PPRRAGAEPGAVYHRLSLERQPAAVAAALPVHRGAGLFSAAGPLLLDLVLLSAALRDGSGRGRSGLPAQPAAQPALPERAVLRRLVRDLSLRDVYRPRPF